MGLYPVALGLLWCAYHTPPEAVGSKALRERPSCPHTGQPEVETGHDVETLPRTCNLQCMSLA
jgi:hypothetical protein